MRRTTAIIYIACLGLLAMQWSGVHAHANEHGFHGAVQGIHDHHHDHGDEHDGDVDVRVVDFGLSASKVLFLFAIGLPLLLVSPARSDVPPQWVTPQPLRRRARWRPPLRAPPHADTIV